MERRKFITNSGKTTLGVLVGASGFNLLESCGPSKKNTTTAKAYWNAPNFTQKPLGYAYNSLEPNIDAATMEIHYTKHAAAYLKNMTDALQDENLTYPTLENLLQNISKHSVKLRNNAGGHYNHEMFWKSMIPAGKLMSDSFKSVIENSFVSVSDFKNKFSEAGTKRFGSGWAWLVMDANKKLQIASTPNQDNPLMDISELRGYPLLCLDVWEHAYYLKYQNKRADYITAWWNVVNWSEVESRYNFSKSI